MKYCPFVEYYRRHTALRGEPISLPGVGDGWRKVRGPFGTYYAQEATGHMLPTDQVERYLQFKRDLISDMLAEVPVAPVERRLQFHRGRGLA